MRFTASQVDNFEAAKAIGPHAGENPYIGACKLGCLKRGKKRLLTLQGVGRTEGDGIKPRKRAVGGVA